MNRPRSSMAALILLISATIPAMGQTRFRTPMRIPDIPGYKTLKCDFHIHTVFSDGAVWPDIRSEEAWREGLDAIAITDHIEYQPHKEDLPTNHGRSYEIAKPLGDRLSVDVISGSEITRDMPPGHLNAIFMHDVKEVETDDWRDAVRIAHGQGAFIFWNHPGWEGQQPDGVAKWYPEHQELVDAGRLHGIEVVNTREYYPEAHRWCVEKNLTMLSNSDVHNPANLDYEVRQGDHRPVTLVFAKDRLPGSIKEALFARRTAVYSSNMLIGDESFLRPIFTRSIAIENPSVTVKGRGSAFVQIHNESDVDYELEGGGDFEALTAPKALVLRAGKTVLLQVRGTSKEREGRQSFRIPYSVTNLKTTPDATLSVELEIDVTFEPDPD